MPEEIEAMINYSGAVGAFLSVSEVHFYNPSKMGNGNVTDTSLIETEKES